MNARSRRLRLSNGIELETPLLVPAMSSQAIGPVPYASDPSAKPKLTTCSIVHSETLIYAIDEVLLLSAYDIHHELLADCRSFESAFSHSRYAGPRLLMIDCGWYEAGDGPSGSPFVEGLEKTESWEESQYGYTLDQLDSDVRAVAVSWDYDGPYGEQIRRAQDFFGHRRRFASTILLKRPGESRFHHFEKLSGEDIRNLRAFDIVGVTEKELGDSVLERVTTLARLRKQFDDLGVPAPIHVFGGLDPLLTPLYFAAGGEIFDGLGWLRYSYRDGITISRDAAALLSRQVDKRWMQVMTTVQLGNLDALRELAGELRLFAHQRGDWSKLRQGENLRPIWEHVEERLGRRDRG